MENSSFGDVIPADSESNQEQIAESAKLEQILADLGAPLGRNGQRIGRYPWEAAMYQRVNEQIYFWEDNLFKSYHLTTQELREYKRVKVQSSDLFLWLVSGDGQKVAWVEKVSSSYVDSTTNFIESAVYVADLNTGQTSMFKEKGNLEIIILANFFDPDALYYGKQRTDVGGRFVFQYLLDLYKYNPQTEKVELILDRDISSMCAGDYITALSDDGRLAAYFQGNTLFIKELPYGAEQKIPISDFGGTSFFYNGFFTSDQKKFGCRYLTFLAETDEEIRRNVVVDLETNEVAFQLDDD